MSDVTTQEPASSDAATAAERRSATAALAALALGGFAIGTTEFVPMGLLPEISHGIHVRVTTGGHLVSMYALGVVVGAPVLAGLGARRKRRELLIALMGVYALGNVLSALMPSYGTLMAARFIAGLPHGAYFGVATLVAADLVGAERRGRAVARVFLGLTVANVVGVPFVTFLGQHLGWRAAFVTAGLLAVLTALAVWRFVPARPADLTGSFRRELTALRRPQVWLTVATGAIGGGGLFAIYSYISPILTHRSHLSVSLVPVVLAIWGLGMVTGGLIGGRLLDWRPVPVMYAAFLAMAASYALFALTSMHGATAIPSVFLLGIGLSTPTGLQMRLMRVSGEAQSLGAALNHSAFNIANALGAWIGGAVIAAGWGYAAPMWAAVGLSLAGMVIFAVSLAVDPEPGLG